MRKACLLLFVFLMTVLGGPQQPPEKTRTGESVSIVRNESTTRVTVGYHTAADWKEITLEPGKDSKIAGDRVRIATTRDDKAIVTVDYPLEAGKKYRIVWNAQAAIWDFSRVAE